MAGWVYEIKDPGSGVDINRHFGPRYGLAYEEEIAFEGGIPPQSIRGAYEYAGGRYTGYYVPNPGFEG
jgi:hypothetical protein